MKSKLIKFITVGTLLVQLGAINVIATPVDNNDIKEKVKQFGQTVTNSINVNGQEVNLYIEFENIEDALNTFKEKYKYELSFIKQNLELEELTIYNWQNYYDVIVQLSDVIKEIPENILINLVDMDGFFDIYENTNKNLEIITFYQQLKGNNRAYDYIDKNFNSIELEALSMLLPYTSEINIPEKRLVEFELTDLELPRGEWFVGMKKPAKEEPKATIGINQTAAINYASTYATNRNKTKYDSFSADCTNFVSQILENGGIKQISSTNEYSGWWHTSNKNALGITTHKHSVSWIRADTFCKYMGVSYKSKVHRDFSAKVYAADIIAYDKGSDGDWDHVGFVTQADGYTGNYGGKVYYDYKVAQHTSDYHAWTSSSTNGWENLENSGYTYAVIRK